MSQNIVMENLTENISQYAWRDPQMVGLFDSLGSYSA